MTSGRPEGPFVEAMALAVRQAGAVARGLQSRVLNEGKYDDTVLPHDDDALRRRRAAKTVADEVVQEILLLAASRALASDAVGLDAEENTPSKALFRGAGTSQRTLVIDPLDGTVQYSAGESSYSICVGLVHDGKLDAILVYFPARDTAYVLDEAGLPFECHGVALGGLTQATRVQVSANHATKRVYVNSRVPSRVQQRLTVAGFEVVNDTNDGMDGIAAPDCLLACVAGTAAAYVSHTRQMRDILLGGILGASEGGYACDWSGEELGWPHGGRVPGAVFGSQQSRSAILACLSGARESL